MRTATRQSDAKERILQTALDLFYRQGYYQTGINQIIEEADVSKATFYSHFPSKEDLALAYIQYQHTKDMKNVKDMLKKHADPYARFMAFIKGMEEWIVSTDFRGCEFLNIAAEICCCDHPVRKEVKYHMDAMRSLLKDLAEDLIKSDPKYKHLKAQELADKYFIIFNGAIASSVEYHDTWPMKLAVEQIENLLR